MNNFSNVSFYRQLHYYYGLNLTRHFLIPLTGGVFAPLGPFLCPTTEEKKWPIAPKPGP
jgi:hypothetical protein